MQAREPIVSNVERQCILDLLLKQKRLDGRKMLEFRKLELTFTDQLGGCVVDLGQTKVFSQVSCDIAKPRSTRPNEGLLFVNLEFSPLASPAFEADRSNDLSIEANRIIERCLLDSRCVDMESLCIISGEVVWEIRLDIRVLCHEGNLVDACCISAIAALSHFKRPDVTVFASDEIHAEESTSTSETTGSQPPGCGFGRMKFHSSCEKALVSLNIQHIPVCVTLCFLDQGRKMIVDPTRLEELNLEGKMVVAVNNQKEVCTLHLACGGLALSKDGFLSHVNRASTICSETIIAKIKEKLRENEGYQKANSLQKKLEAKINIDHSVPIAPVHESEIEKIPAEEVEKPKKGPKEKKTTKLAQKASGDYKISQKNKVGVIVSNSSNWLIKSATTANENKDADFLDNEEDNFEVKLEPDEVPKLDSSESMSDDEESVKVVL